MSVTEETARDAVACRRRTCFSSSPMTFTFFVSLGQGIQQRVINRIYPVNQIEVDEETSRWSLVALERMLEVK